MDDQAAELRQLVRQRATLGAPHRLVAPLVVVSGGKGGVGTTTIAANLAVALARQGRRAVFVDADLDHGGHARWNESSDHGTIVDVLAGRAGAHDVLQRGPAGIQSICGAWASGEVSDHAPAAQDRLITELKHLAPHADLVVVDAGSSRTHFARRCWQAATAVIVVTTPDATAVMNAYAAIKTLARAESRGAVHTLANCADDPREGDEIQDRITAACRKFLGTPCSAIGCIPSFEDDCRTGDVLVFPARSTAARALDRVTDTLWAKTQMGAASLSERLAQQAIVHGGPLCASRQDLDIEPLPKSYGGEPFDTLT